MCVKRVVYRAVNVACSVIVILFTNNLCHDFEHQLTCVRNNRCAVALQDGREIGDKRLEFHFTFERLPLTRAYMPGNSTTLDHQLMVDWGHGICFRAHAKQVCKAQRLNKLGPSPRLGGFASSILTVIGDDQVHDLRALIIIGRRTDIQVDLKRI